MKRMLPTVLILTLTIFAGSTVFAGCDPAERAEEGNKNMKMEKKVKEGRKS